MPRPCSPDPKYFGRLPFGGLFVFTHAGVDFFFVLSGFIIYFIHHDEIGRPDRVVSYCIKRCIRIFPTYWVVLAGFGIILAFSPTQDRSEQDFVRILTSATLLPVAEIPILNVAWSLKHEVLFYALFATLFISRPLGFASLGMWLCIIIWNIAFAWVTGAPYFSGAAGEVLFRIFNVEFFFGMAVAHLVLKADARGGRAALVAGVVLFFGTGALEWLGMERRPEWPPMLFGYALGAALTLYGLVSTEKAGQLRVPAPLVALGAASYSIYLLHVVAIMLAQQSVLIIRRFVPLQLEATFLVIVILAVAAGIAFSRLVEQPMIRILRPGNPAAQAAVAR